MRRVLAVSFLLAAVVVSDTHGQIGQDPSECLKRWGDPVSGRVDTDGFGTLWFTAEKLGVEIEFVSHTAQHAVYRSPSLDDDAIKRILSVNSGGLVWHIFELPGGKLTARDSREWMRSDEMAMAKLAPGALTILGATWNQHLAAPAPSATADGVAAPLNIAPSPSPPDDFIGLWRNERPRHAAVVLHIREGGELSWIVLGGTERRELKARWNRETSNGPASYLLKEKQPSSAALPRTIGTGVRESPSVFRFRVEKATADTRPVASQWNTATEMVFERIGCMPLWEPKAVAILPAKGSSRSDTMQLFGRPSGTMTSGGCEALVYPWGSLLIEDGVVVWTE
jgi:hypothetical protein